MNHTGNKQFSGVPERFSTTYNCASEPRNGSKEDRSVEHALEEDIPERGDTVTATRHQIPVPDAVSDLDLDTTAVLGYD